MNVRNRPRLILAALLLALGSLPAVQQFHPPALRVAPGTGEGTATLQPASMTAAQIATAVRYAEVVRLDRATKRYSIVARWDSPGPLLQQRFRDPASAGAAMYYVRAEMIGLVARRVARVWSSPVWIQVGSESERTEGRQRRIFTASP